MKGSLFGPVNPIYYNSGPRILTCEDPGRYPVKDEYCRIEPERYSEKKAPYDPVNVIVKLAFPVCRAKPDCCGDKHRCCCGDWDRCCCDWDRCCCHRNRCCCCDPCRSVTNSATGGAGPLPIIVAGTLLAAIPVVSVTVNTRCICDPAVLLNFTTQISLPAASTTTLVFQVLRSGPCNGTAVPVGSTFTYTNTTVAATADSFSFQVFDNNLSQGTYTYSVVLTTGTTATVAGVTLVNSTLSARATSSR